MGDRPDITIPKDALDLAVGVWYGTPPDEVDPEDAKAAEGDMLACLEAAAPLIVASWADRIAAEHMPPLQVEDYDEVEEAERFGVRSMCTLLQRLAAQLRGETRG